MDTVPLLTPTMETELLKSPWVFPQPKASAVKEEEEKVAASSTWEENFQDLSGWCIDTFQGQCDFPIGESPVFKLSGTKYEGNSVLSSEEGVLKDFMSVTDEEKWNMKMNIAGTAEHSNNNCHGLQSASEATSELDKEDSVAESNTPFAWLKLSKKETPATSTTPWSKQNITSASVPLQSKYSIEYVDMDDVCSTSYNSVENQRESLDMLRTVETIGSDSFDLLSYLCDDEMRSPDDSVSTDSSVASKAWSPSKTFITDPQTDVEVKTERKKRIKPGQVAESRAASTATSSSVQSSIVSSRRSERTRTSVGSSKVEKTYNRTAKRLGRKRYVEAEPEDRSYATHYRESREKNNEASRKSRMNKKAKESEMAMQAVELERDNRILKMKVEELEKLVTSMRSALLKSALKKEF